MKTPDFVNAQELSKEHPTTFFVKSIAELKSNIKPFNHVKVAIAGERFWVQVTEVHSDHLIGKVDNDLVNSEEHGLHYDDIVKVDFDHIYNYM